MLVILLLTKFTYIHSRVLSLTQSIHHRCIRYKPIKYQPSIIRNTRWPILHADSLRQALKALSGESMCFGLFHNELNVWGDE